MGMGGENQDIVLASPGEPIIIENMPTYPEIVQNGVGH